MTKKLFLVTFPVDLGNTTFENKFTSLFSGNVDLKTYQFHPEKNKKHPTSILGYTIRIFKRFLASFALQRAVLQAKNEGRIILFHGVSPALFALPVTSKNTSFIVTDWTRKLYESIHNQCMSNFLQTAIHKKVLHTQKRVMCLTNAVINQIETDYKVPRHKLVNVKLPFDQDLQRFSPSINRNDDEVRLLFVGGDFGRKGGPELIQWFKESKKTNLRLTFMTNYPIDYYPGIKVEANVKYGEAKHSEIFSSHDIFVLPTKCDSYPSVLGEAACAGLAVLTTKHALGAPEIIKNGINGFICESSEDLMQKLDYLIKNRETIERMKRESRNLMEENFSKNIVLNEYLDFLFK